MSAFEENTCREGLLSNVKKEVKQLMDVAVTRKVIHEDNSCITSLCASVEACLLHGLKSAGYFKTNTTLNLLIRAAKQSPEAEYIIKLCDEYESLYCDSNSVLYYKKLEKNKSLQKINYITTDRNNNDYSGPFKILSKKIFARDDSPDTNNEIHKKHKTPNFAPTFYKGSACYKFLWIRLAFLEKSLVKIIEFLLDDGSQYYSKNALCMDPVDSVILCSLLCGPCSLEFTRVKVCDNSWQDPNADELIQRHSMQGASIFNQNCYQNPGLSRHPHSQSMPRQESSAKKMVRQNEHSKSLRCSSYNNGTEYSTCNNNTSDNNLKKANSENNRQNSRGSLTSPKLKLGQSASVLAKRKASISALEDISNTNSKLNFSNTVCSPIPRDTPQQARLKPLISVDIDDSNLKKSSKVNPDQSTPQISATKLQKMPPPSNMPLRESHFLPVSNNLMNNTQSISGAKEYVESLHQNSKSQLIYGKNNVIVKQKELELVGYLSLHHQMTNNASNNSLVVKWTPNQMMNGDQTKSKTVYWDYAIHVNLDTIVYLHCHRDINTDDSVQLVLVGQDGVQNSPLHFPTFNSLVQFLICLENGLETSYGKLEPTVSELSDECGESPLPEQDDFVFRIINNNSNFAFATIRELVKNSKNNQQLNTQNDQQNSKNPPEITLSKKSSKNFKLGTFFSSPTPSKESIESNLEVEAINNIYSPSPISQSSLILDNSNAFLFLSKIENLQLSPIDYIEYKSKDEKSRGLITRPSSVNSVCSLYTPKLFKSCTVRGSLKKLCEAMSRQILTRAFYGWLTYHRNLKTVGLHLTGLVNNGESVKMDEINVQRPIKNSESYLFSCIKELDQLLPDDQDYINKLASSQELCLNFYLETEKKVDDILWSRLIDKSKNGVVDKKAESLLYKVIYQNGIEQDIRKKIWPFLLEHLTFQMSNQERDLQEKFAFENYKNLIAEWKPFEEYANLREKKTLSISMRAKELTKCNHPPHKRKDLPRQAKRVVSSDASLLSHDSGLFLNESDNISLNNSKSKESVLTITDELSSKAEQLIKNVTNANSEKVPNTNSTILNEDDGLSDVFLDGTTSTPTSMIARTKKLLNKLLLSKPEVINTPENIDGPKNDQEPPQNHQKNKNHELNKRIVETPKIDSMYSNKERINNLEFDEDLLRLVSEYIVKKAILSAQKINHNNLNSQFKKKPILERQHSLGRLCLTNKMLVNTFALNIHRIDKDVTRCDRNYWYFTNDQNLQKLKNIVYTYTWENLEIGYIQGMCDLVAPLLVIFDDESLTYACFKQLMNRMSDNFPQGAAMDQNFSSMRLLIQILDADLYEHMYNRGDFTHFYFSYRWFLLDFKRELLYDDVFSVWETIWSAKFVCSQHFYLFVALALVETYRDIIIENNMDFTDIIKFFNEMAEKHKAKQVLQLARNLVVQLQKLIYNRDTDIF